MEAQKPWQLLDADPGCLTVAATTAHRLTHEVTIFPPNTQILKLTVMPMLGDAVVSGCTRIQLILRFVDVASRDRFCAELERR